jgi:hypothetical protein
MQVIIPIDEERSEVNDRFNSYLEQLVHERLNETGSGGVLATAGGSVGGVGSAGTSSVFGGLSAALAAAAAVQCPATALGAGSASGYHTPNPGAGSHPTSTLGPHQGDRDRDRAHADAGPFADAYHQHQQHQQGAGAGGGDRDWDVEMPATPNRTGPPSQRGMEELPWELFILEAALGEVCGQLSRETEVLHAAAVPALEDLVVSSDRANLERVRRVKTAHQRMVGRVRVLREAIHRLMGE